MEDSGNRRQGRHGAAALLGAALLQLTLTGCTVGFTDQSERDRAMAFLNQRQYGEAARVLEESLQRNPSRQTAWLLAHAHLGQGGFELFRFGSDVLGKQAPRELMEYAIDAPDCPRSEIQNLRGHDLRCLTMRLIRHTPEAEERHFMRARDLFREYFPDESKAPVDVNFLSAVVEIGSSFSRLRSLIRKSVAAPPQSMVQEDERFAHAVRNAKRLFEEVVRGFKRASWSYQKVARLVVTFDGMPIVRSGGAKLIFNEGLGFPSVLRFAAEVLHEEARDVDRELNLAAEGYIGIIPRVVVRVFEEIDQNHLGAATGSLLTTAWKFESAMRLLLARAADQLEPSESENARFNFFELVWENPPELVRGLSRAVHQAWMLESPAPLREFMRESGEEWRELENLAEGWRVWFEESLDSAQVRFIEEHLSLVLAADPRLMRPPSSLGDPEIRLWMSDFVSAIRGGLQMVLSAELPGLPSFRADQLENGQRLLDETSEWISRNFWEVH